MPKEEKGKPDAWSDELWEVYEKYGDFDHMYVKSCNRFLKATLDLYPAPISELIHELTQVCLEQDMEPNPEDQLDVYQAWYAKHIKWDKECFCGIDDWFLDKEGTPLMKPDDEKEEYVPPTQVRPWFLGASIQLAKRLAEGEVPEPKQGLLADAIGQTASVVATVKDQNGAPMAAMIEWMTTDEPIASISSEGPVSSITVRGLDHLIRNLVYRY